MGHTAPTLGLDTVKAEVKLLEKVARMHNFYAVS